MCRVALPLEQLRGGGEIADVLRVAITVEAYVERVAPSHRRSARRPANFERVERAEEDPLLEELVEVRRPGLAPVEVAQIVPTKICDNISHHSFLRDFTRLTVRHDVHDICWRG